MDTYSRLKGIPIDRVEDGYYITYLGFWNKLGNFRKLLDLLDIEVIELANSDYLFNNQKVYLNDRGSYYAFNYNQFKEKLKQYIQHGKPK